jgi:phosphoribosylglycinamide formyltransferase 1
LPPATETPRGRIGVLISGRGSNLQALIDAQAAGVLGGQIVVVISNVPGAGGLERAARAGIPTRVSDHRERTRVVHEEELTQILEGHRVALVCLAGYMRLLTGPLLDRFAGRILNVHPSLLPAFPGVDAQRQAWEHGVKVSGATVHFVERTLDAGPIVLQEAVPVQESDDAEALAARILQAEHRIYPRAVALVLGEKARVEGRRVRLAAS